MWTKLSKQNYPGVNNNKKKKKKKHAQRMAHGSETPTSRDPPRIKRMIAKIEKGRSS